MTIFSDLISNVALLLALSILYSFLTRIWKHEEIPGRILGGFLFGLVAVAGMINPFNYEPGVIFDARSVVVSMAGLYGGPLTAAISTLIAGTYRLWLGGTGALTGFGVIFTSAALGVGYYYLRQRRPEVIGSLYLFVFGIIVHLFMLLWMLTLPWPLAFHVLAKISLPVMLIFPLGTLFLGTLLLDQEKRNYAQYQLAESEKRYRRIVETANEGIWVIDAQFKTTFVNRVMAEMLGYVEDEMFGRIITDFMVEDELADQSLRMAKRQKGESETYERTYRKKDGSSVWCMVSASPLINEKGDFTGSFAMLTDITERKQAEEALRESEEKHRLLFEGAGDAIFIHDAEGRMLANNPLACERLGYSHEALMSMTVDQVDTPEEARHAPDRIARLMAKGHLTFETVHQHKDGPLIPTEVSARLITWEGQPAMMSICRDITERKRAEVVLRNREQLLNEMGSLAKIGGWEHDLVTGKATWTKETYKIVGIESGPIPGPAEHLKYYPPKDRELLEKAYRHAMETGEQFDLELQGTTAKGRLLFVRAVGRPEFKDGKCVKMKGILQDITERKKLENQLQQAQKMEAIGTLAGGIAHDFNNVLGIILGNAELAMEDVPDLNPARNNLDEVRKACLRAKDVVSQILAFSRKSETERKTLNIAPVVTESLKLLRASIPTSIEIRQNISNHIDDILGDSTQIHQIMINLCTNASHAMEDEGGILEITLENTDIYEETASRHSGLNPGPYVQLSVSDTGFGMSPEVIDRIFDPYFTTKDVGKGTGLGLSVVHGIVNSHNGRITVESKTGKGTTFNILFPAVERRITSEPKEVQELPTGQERILFVDDEESMVNLNQQRLERLGYKVTPQTDSSEALKLFLSDPNQFDLVITDMTMPRMTGDKLTQEILKIRADMPIILCTGYSERMSSERAQELGIRKYIEKPIEMETLARSVREVLEDNRSTTQFSES